MCAGPGDASGREKGSGSLWGRSSGPEGCSSGPEGKLEKLREILGCLYQLFVLDFPGQQ